jgi:hypothetical protein
MDIAVGPIGAGDTKKGAERINRRRLLLNLIGCD